MKVTLEITGEELMLLYLATGNESAGKFIRECIQQERDFDAVHRLSVARKRASKKGTK